ncbi:hypothetical protein VC83_08460 [Pseudogymnoascus destructans]|uniref:Uncharacterized protein n=2 Tax=Pseudogymnoascus destructans TaxID=655981 RepID=L8FRI4_PSED2|nr:uncharacterized protein VC83_08460 [Pseudogymnoascus destructans]ELR03149.1 hypothetical protein GMDG_05978 [Pseudogymnoascus destructans 20631-21]OAF55142.1 hypothetical protein VC83_08460 [Pseudogymnoascus destructans]
MPARYAAVDAADLLFGRATTVRNGYAARETIACRMGEQDCGPTVKPYHACCPRSTECGSPQLNIYCCEPDKDCKPQLTKLPQCANPEHDMYDFDGFFCCEQGRKGYGNTKSDGNGCGAPDYELQEFDKWLTIAVSGRAITTSSSKTSTGAPSATNPGNTSNTSSASNSSGHSSGHASGHASSTTGPSSSSPTAPFAGAPSSTDGSAGKSSNAGPIAGGVVGGIAALALIAFLVWFLRRRKARSYASAAPPSPSGAYHAQGPEKDVPHTAMGKAAAAQKGEEGGSGGVSELPGEERGDVAAAAEMYSPGMPGTPGQGAAELYSPSVATTAELHGVERGPGELLAWDGRGVPAQLRAGDRGGPVELP